MSSSGSQIDPAFQFAVITPSDTAKLTYTNSAGGVEIKRCRAIYVGTAGDLAVNDDAGNSVLFTGVAAGSVLPISTDVIRATSTTASTIVALY